MPQEQPTTQDCGMGGPNDGISWLMQCGISDLFDPDIEGAVKDGCTHMLLSPFFSQSTELAPHAHFSVPKLLTFSRHVRHEDKPIPFGRRPPWLY